MSQPYFVRASFFSFPLNQTKNRREFFLLIIFTAGLLGILFTTQTGLVAAQSVSSWNTNVTCGANLVTIQNILGSSYPSQSLSGSPYQTSINTGGVPNKRALSPPCTITNTSGQTVSSFVQINGVYLTNYFYETRDCNTSYDAVNGGGRFPNGESLCDSTGNIFTVGTSSGYVHIEFDRDWMAKGYCGPSTGFFCDNSTIIQPVCTISSPCSSTRSIDVQGFVFWDPEGHWELHPFTAWKLSSSSSPDFSILASPTSLNVPASSSSSSTITLTSLNNFAGMVTLFATGSPSGLNLSLIPTSVSLASGGTGTSTLSVGSPIPGSYTVTINGAGGSLSHQASVTVNIVDFSISASPSSMTLSTGSSFVSTISLKSLGGFAGITALSTSSSPPGPALSLGSTTVTLSSGGTGTTTLTISTQSSTPSGNYAITVTGSSGSLSHSTSVLISVVDFSIAANPTFMMVKAGATGVSNVTVTAVSGFAGTVSLGYLITPINGLNCSLSPISVTLGASAVSTLSCAGLAGTSTVTVTGSAGSLSHSVNVTFVVQDFTVTAIPTSVMANVGAAGTSTVTLAPVNGFTGTVALTSTGSLAGLTCGLSPSSIILGTSRTSTLSCSSPTAATFTVTVTGTSGSITHTATVRYEVHDFTITASPTSASINLNGTATSTITVAAINGFTGVAGLTSTVSPSTGLSCTFSPTSVTGSGTSTLSCTSSARGTFAVTVTGTSGTLSHNVTTTFTFVDFILSATSPATTDVGQSATSTIAVNPLNGFTGLVALSDVPLPTGLNCNMINPVSIAGSGNAIVSCSSTVPGIFTLTITGASGLLTHSTNATFRFADFTVAPVSPTLTTVGSYANVTVGIIALNGFRGTIVLSDNPLPNGLTCAAIVPASTSGAGTSTISCSSTIAENYNVTLTASDGIITHTTTATFAFTDFAIIGTSPSPVNSGQLAISTLAIVSLNGFGGMVKLSDAPLADGLSCSAISPSTESGSGSSTLSCSSAIAKTYNLNITGTSGSLSHSTIIQFTVQDFLVSANNPAPVLEAGVPTTSNIAVTPQNGFAGNVTLLVGSSQGVTATLTVPTIQGSGTSILSLVAPSAGNYTVTVTAASGGLIHIVGPILVRVVDFNIVTSPSTFSIHLGSASNSTILLSSMNGYTGNVTLTFSCVLASLSGRGSIGGVGGGGSPALQLAPPMLPLCPNLILGQSNIILPSSTGVDPYLTISADSSLPAGNYLVTLNATDGVLRHSVLIPLQITDYMITSYPSSLVVDPGSNGTSLIILTSLNGFSGTTSLSAASSPVGLTLFFSQSSPVFGSDGLASSILTITVPGGTSWGYYAVLVTATVAGVNRTSVILLTVPTLTVLKAAANLVHGNASAILLTGILLSGFTATFLTMTYMSPRKSSPAAKARRFYPLPSPRGSYVIQFYPKRA